MVRGSRELRIQNYLKRIALTGVILVMTNDGIMSIKVQKMNVPAFRIRIYASDRSIGTVDT